MDFRAGAARLLHRFWSGREAGVMTKRTLGNIVATLCAIAMAAGTMYASIRYLKSPQVLLDWAVLLFSGLVAGIFVWFVVWGHFQEEAK